MDVPVRPGRAGTVLVGPRPAAPAGTGLVRIPGGQVHVDPTAPDDPPFVLVHDVTAAAPALHALHGEAVADAVVALGGGREPDGEVPAEPGTAAGPVLRVGLVRWLETHSPDALSAALLDVEFGAAGAELAELLDGPEREEAAERLRRRAGFLAGLSRRLRDGDPAPPGLAALVADALPRAHGELTFADPAFDDVHHEVELAAARTALGDAGAGPVDWARLAGLPGVGRREPAAAGWRGDPGPGGERTASVDWLQVPRGLLRTDEDTVTWRLVDDGARVEVEVSALPGAPGGALAFRLYTDDRPLPIAVGPLRPDPGGGRWTGSGALHAPASGELTVDVHDPSGTAPPRLGADGTSARAARWAARGIGALRLGVTGVDDAAEQALDEAAHLFSRAADGYTRAAGRAGSGERTRAVRREARCRAVQAAVAARLGEPVPDVEPQPPVAVSDVRVPDLSGPGWRPLAAESALGYPGG